MENLLGSAPEDGDLFKSLGRLEVEGGFSKSHEGFCLSYDVLRWISGGDEEILMDASCV